MKKIIGCFTLIAVMVFTAAFLADFPSVNVYAMLTEEEQNYYRQKKAEEQTEPSTETEEQTEPSTETEGQTETPAEMERQTELSTETETQTESSTEETAEASGQPGAIMARGSEDAPLIAIDPGHQGPGQDLSGVEPNGPGSDVMKARLASGTSGSVSGLAEYELVLDVSLKLREELLRRGYRVIMTRETNDIDISNIERCQVANEAGADILLRIHANGSEDSSVAGALTTAPSASNPYLIEIYNSCVKLADDMINAYCEATGLQNRGLWITDDMTGMNWSQMPVTILEMGFMTNPGDDAYMADPANQDIMVQGIANGVDRYFGGAPEVPGYSQVETESESETQVESESETEIESEPQTESESETESETQAESESDTETEVESETQTEVESETETEVESETQTESESETETEVESETQTESESETEVQGDGPLVMIDPGHQAPGAAQDRMIAIGPGAGEQKDGVRAGTYGSASGLREYELNLDVCMKLKKELQSRGYRVMMTRETNDVDLDEAQRSELANEAGAQIMLRIHANRSDESDQVGASTNAPTAENPYLSNIYESCVKLADDVLNAYCETTGLANRGIWLTDESPELNWCQMPVTVLELGFMSNPDEDAYMADADNQDTMVQGIANGVDRYFGR